MSETHPELVAWLDGELPPVEAAEVVLHLESCDICRRQCAAFGDTSAALRLYRDAVFKAANAEHKLPRRLAAAAALAAIAIVAILVAFTPRHVVAPPLPSPVAAVTPTPISSSEGPHLVVAHEPIHPPHHSVSAARRTVGPVPPTDSVVEIAIPADAVFAPGALPEGMKLFGEMRISPDGSLREIRLKQ